jgi:hypothetical protein
MNNLPAWTQALLLITGITLIVIGVAGAFDKAEKDYEDPDRW